MTDTLGDGGSNVRLLVTAMESEVIESAADEVGVKYHWSNGELILENIDEQQKEKIIEKCRWLENDYSSAGDYEAAQWCQDALYELGKVEISDSSTTEVSSHD